MTTAESATARPSADGGGLQTARRALTMAEAMPHWLIALIARIGVGAVFFRSGRTKVDGLTITDSTFFLFAEEYRVPLLPSDIAAYMATTAEHVLPVLLFVGFASRLSALGLLGMTLVIQAFVYPGSWPDHALWAAALLLIIARGPGALSLDTLIRRKMLGT